MQSVVTPSVQCQHAAPARNTTTVQQLRPSARFMSEPTQLVSLIFYPGRSLLDAGTFLSSAAQTAQSVVTTLRAQDPRLQFSRLPNAQSGCGTSHIQLKAVDIMLLGAGRQVANGAQRNVLKDAQQTK